MALKRLNIAIKRIIHVEHDKVAKHVYRWNHDVNYMAAEKEIEMSMEKQPTTTMPNNNIEAMIKHEYYDSFEEFIYDMRHRKDLCTLIIYINMKNMILAMNFNLLTILFKLLTC